VLPVLLFGSRLALSPTLSLLVLLSHATQLLLCFLVTALQLSHLASFLFCKDCALFLFLTFTPSLSLGLCLFELGTPGALFCLSFGLAFGSSRFSLSLRVGLLFVVVFGAARSAAVPARHHHVLAILHVRRVTHTAAFMSQSLRLVLCCATAGCRSFATSALVFCLVSSATALAGLFRCRCRCALLTTESEHALEAAHGSGSAGDTSKRTHRIRVAARATGSFTVTFAAGPLGLNWGRVHLHGVDKNRVVGTRRRCYGFERLR
jgi:hypothetical protein